jgi:uncharacterized protein (TIGR02757 family)
MNRKELALALEKIYQQFHRPEYISPDPLEVVYRYKKNEDREIVALIAAALAYGRVQQILVNIDRVLEPLGKSPIRFLTQTNPKELRTHFKAFQHRWTTSGELIAFLLGIQHVVKTWGSLENAFIEYHTPKEGTVRNGLIGMVDAILQGQPHNSLLSDPAKSSACKRLYLYLRWMVRDDQIDTGCWTQVDPGHLIVPLDTHLFRAAKAFRMTKRKQANIQTSLEITKAFGRLAPGDPLKYDFVVTRLGIRGEMDLKKFLSTKGDDVFK